MGLEEVLRKCATIGKEKWIYEGELEWLYRRAEGMSTIVEIGSWKGRSTYALCSACLGRVYAVDPFWGSGEVDEKIEREGSPYEEFLSNVGHFRNLRVFPMTSERAAESRLIPKKVDMVFIDGCHYKEFVLQDIQLWLPRCAVLLCGHDDNRESVIDALNESFPKGWKEGPYTIWIGGLNGGD